MYGLSERLRLAATLVPDNARVCDVGTDHGYLAAALYKSGRVKSVIATDINEKPLAHAAESIKRLKADGVELRLCDGLAGVSPQEVDTVIIAGMGGEVISGILSRAEWVKNQDITLILQPMTSAWELRSFLYKNGFNILREPCLSEKGKVYSVILARFDGICRPADMFSCCMGEIKADSTAGTEYIKKQYKRCQQCACKLSGVEGKQAEFEEYSTTALKLKKLLEEHNAF
ncbi:MAG: SAM-dependent methyltransferase [Clostridia bacterium]|nr:SAM-dependent methyltransferase [Clostridia bacterium]